jgi:hypothetical protein
MRTICIALLGLAASGCIVVHDNPQPQPQPQPPADTTPPVYRIAPGRSTIVQPGTQAGYGITANLGGSYRIVWTGQSPQAYDHFTGSIHTPGTFTDFVPGCADGSCPLERGDIVNAPVDDGAGQTITFDTYATDGLDGLDFAVSLEPVEFDLVIDGARYPQLVFFPDTDTGAIDSPGTMPFQLTTN